MEYILTIYVHVIIINTLIHFSTCKKISLFLFTFSEFWVQKFLWVQKECWLRRIIRGHFRFAKICVKPKRERDREVWVLVVMHPSVYAAVDTPRDDDHNGSSMKTLPQHQVPCLLLWCLPIFHPLLHHPMTCLFPPVITGQPACFLLLAVVALALLVILVPLPRGLLTFTILPPRHLDKEVQQGFATRV